MTTAAASTIPSPPGPRYGRVLLKVSGEAFCKPGQFGIDGEELEVIAREIAAAAQVGVQLAVCVGGGNIIRGSRLAKEGHIVQATADYMGMLGTVINGLALKEMLEKIGQPARVLSAINLAAVAETFIRGRAIRLRAAETGAEALLKATKVDGIYDKDPKKFPDAKKFEKLTFAEALQRRLEVMDLTAFDMCFNRNIPIVVFNMKSPGHIAEVVSGKSHGTRVTMD